MPHDANQMWHDFAAAMSNERDPDRITDLIAKLSRDLAEVDKNAGAVIEIRNSAS